MPFTIGKCKLFRIKHNTLLEGETFLRNKHEIAFFEIKYRFFGRKENTISLQPLEPFSSLMIYLGNVLHELSMSSSIIQFNFWFTGSVPFFLFPFLFPIYVQNNFIKKFFKKKNNNFLSVKNKSLHTKLASHFKALNIPPAENCCILKLLFLFFFFFFFV